MRILKTLIAVLIIGLIVVGAVGCRAGAATTTTATRQVKVALGTITNEVTGTATLGLAKTQDLAFAMAGTVDQIMVQASDTVTKGELLAILDNSTQQDTIHSLQESVSNAQRNVNNKQYALTKAQRVDTSSLTNAQYALTQANREIETRQLSKKQADLNLLAAQNTLANISDVRDAQAAVDAVNANIAYAQSAIDGADAIRDPILRGQWSDQLKLLNSQLKDAQARLTQVLQGSGVSSTNVSIQIQQDVFAVQQAQKAVSDAQNAIDGAQNDINNAQLAVNNAQTALDDAQVTINNAKLDVSDAQQSLADAQSKLSDQQTLSPQIVAPFDGFITSIKVSGGDAVLKGSVAMSIADPTQFQASFMVSETDIFSVKVGQSAQVTIDSLSGQIFPAKFTAIAPLATVTSGVVNYAVTAELTSLIPIGSGAAGALSGLFGSGTLPAGINRTNFPSGVRPSGIPTGALPSGFPTARPTGTFAVGNGNGSASDNGTATRTVVATPVALKQGLSASVSIIIQQKRNVLIVPIRAVTTSAGKSTVQVVNGTTTDSVTVTTGLSDSSNIEIVSGLTEGQTVVVKATGTTSSNSGFGPGGGGAIRIP